MEDSDIDVPLDLGGAAGGAVAGDVEGLSEEQVAMLMSRGFTPAPAQCQGVERDWQRRQ